MSLLKQLDALCKEASEKFYYHASPVQGIKEIWLSEDTSGNNKGKGIFASEKPEFAAAFGVKWHDGNASLSVDHRGKSGEQPTVDNFNKAILKTTDAVKTDKPCSMYKIKGDFENLRYDKDLEVHTKKPVEIISEEKFNSYQDMAKMYDVEIKKISDKYIDKQLKTRKSIEKGALEILEDMFKEATDEDTVNSNGKIPSIENALSDDVAKKVATMLATSHEYKTPNVDGALSIAKNYTWELTAIPVNRLEGIHKPVNKEKVLDMALSIKKDGNVKPFIVVNNFHGIRPQTSGKVILVDGHHRKEAVTMLGYKEVPVYKGTYTGKAELSAKELRQRM